MGVGRYLVSACCSSNYTDRELDYDNKLPESEIV